MGDTKEPPADPTRGGKTGASFVIEVVVLDLAECEIDCEGRLELELELEIEGASETDTAEPIDATL